MVCLSKECLMSIQHEVDHLVSRIGLESVAIPVQRHLTRRHGIEHVVLEVLQGLSHLCFCHVPIISTGFGRSLVSVCHLANWSGSQNILYNNCPKLYPRSILYPCGQVRYSLMHEKMRPCIHYTIASEMGDIVCSSISGTHCWSVVKIFVIFECLLLFVTLIVTLSIRHIVPEIFVIVFSKLSRRFLILFA